MHGVMCQCTDREGGQEVEEDDDDDEEIREEENEEEEQIARLQCLNVGRNALFFKGEPTGYSFLILLT